MILDFFDGKLDGNTWESLCQQCYKIRYQKENYTEIPAVQGGDAGIEGFTNTGIVNQCYCPEREYSDEDLYIHLRNKMTKDIQKLINTDYAKRLRKLGVPSIREWHFVIPMYKDSRIIEHAHSKTEEVLKLKRENPQQYTHIHTEFTIVIKTAEDFKIELVRLIRSKTLDDVKVSLAIKHTGNVDWTKCDSAKVANIKRKVKAIMQEVSDTSEDYIDVVNIYVESYVKGLLLLNKLKTDVPTIYEDIFTLEQTYKKDVSIKTKTNPNHSMNHQIFMQIISDFEKSLSKQCNYLNIASIAELKTDIISAWLADCSMQFKSGIENE